VGRPRKSAVVDAEVAVVGVEEAVKPPAAGGTRSRPRQVASGNEDEGQVEKEPVPSIFLKGTLFCFEKYDTNFSLQPSEP